MHDRKPRALSAAYNCFADNSIDSSAGCHCFDWLNQVVPILSFTVLLQFCSYVSLDYEFMVPL
jgi:hypothetical protein